MHQGLMKLMYYMSIKYQLLTISNSKQLIFNRHIGPNALYR